MSIAVLTDTVVKPPVSFNRRASLRFDALNRVIAERIGSGMPVRVRDVGFAGFSLETVDHQSESGPEKFRFLSSGGWSIVVRARRVYCRPSCATDGTPRYVSGYIVEQEKAEEAMMSIIERITSVRYSKKVTRFEL